MVDKAPEGTTEEQARRERGFRLFDRSEIPLTVYAVIIVTMSLLWIFQAIHPDLTLGLFTELLGAVTLPAEIGHSHAASFSNSAGVRNPSAECSRLRL